MRALGIILIIAGAAVVALGGISYVKSRHQTNVGPVSVSTEHHGYITPLAGAVAIGVGIVLVAAGGPGGAGGRRAMP